MVKILPITKARNELPQIVSQAKRGLNKYIVTVNGLPEAVIMSHDEYESLVETLDILSQPQALKNIKQSEREIKLGKYVSLEDLRKELKISS